MPCQSVSGEDGEKIIKVIRATTAREATRQKAQNTHLAQVQMSIAHKQLWTPKYPGGVLFNVAFIAGELREYSR